MLCKIILTYSFLPTNRDLGFEEKNSRRGRQKNFHLKINLNHTFLDTRKVSKEYALAK
jgi:hypothetical protein